MELLPIEQISHDLVSRIGEVRATRILDAIQRRFDRRFNIAADASMSPINPEWIYRTDIEKELTYKLKLGLMLTGHDSPAEARKRILLRREARRREHSQSKASRN